MENKKVGGHKNTIAPPPPPTTRPASYASINREIDRYACHTLVMPVNL